MRWKRICSGGRQTLPLCLPHQQHRRRLRAVGRPGADEQGRAQPEAAGRASIPRGGFRTHVGWSTAKKAKFRDGVTSAAFVFMGFRRAVAMGFFRVLFWRAVVARAVPRCYSRFGIFNSRLGPDKFPFSRLRELAGKGLICLPFFGAVMAIFGNDRENSLFHGNNREFRGRRNGWRRNLEGRRSALPAADHLVACPPRERCSLRTTGISPMKRAPSERAGA